MTKVLHGNCLEELGNLDLSNAVIVTDPPFNVGYHYNEYSDRKEETQYYSELKQIFSLCPAVVVHYPESLYRIAIEIGKAPQKVVSWVYNSNTRKQHRDIAFFDVMPDFTKVRQPYKNPNDKRIKERIKRGYLGGALYDWWYVDQIKNVSKEKTEHPCQMPIEVMENVIRILPDNVTIIDPFLGSGTTGIACARLNRNFIGIELDSKYYELSRQRIQEEENVISMFSLA